MNPKRGRVRFEIPRDRSMRGGFGVYCWLAGKSKRTFRSYWYRFFTFYEQCLKLSEALRRLRVCEFSMREGTMRTRFFFLIATVSMVFAILQAAPNPAYAAGEGQVPAALAGQVTSQEEGPMEGVVLSAKKEGSTITVSVISDNKGHYSFPANRLDSGHYTLKTRAVGYVLDASAAVDLAAHKPATADLTLHKTKNLVPQMTNAEWLLSIPGTDDQKAF